MQWPRSHSGCLVLLGFQGKQGISLPQHLILFYLLSCLALPATAQCLAKPTRGANSCFAAGTTAVSCPRGVDCQFSSGVELLSVNDPGRSTNRPGVRQSLALLGQGRLTALLLRSSSKPIRALNSWKQQRRSCAMTRRSREPTLRA